MVDLPNDSNSMVMFHSYASLPKGIHRKLQGPPPQQAPARPPLPARQPWGRCVFAYRG